jgi:hypothetical protein
MTMMVGFLITVRGDNRNDKGSDGDDDEGTQFAETDEGTTLHWR